MIQLASLVAAGIGPTQARTFEAPLLAACARFAIDTPARQAAFVAQCAHESRHFTALEEGLYYRTPDRIRAIFRSTVPNVAVAQTLACNPQRLANHVYANRNGNRDEASGDGWRYRGRGLIQLTGRANYTRAAADLGRPYVDEADLLLDPFDACLTAAWFWNSRNLNALADAGRIDDITRAVNGAAMAGANERRQLFATAHAAFGGTPPATRGRPEKAGGAKKATAARRTTATTAAKKNASSKTTGVARKSAADRKSAVPKETSATRRKVATKKRAPPTKRAAAKKKKTAPRATTRA